MTTLTHVEMSGQLQDYYRSKRVLVTGGFGFVGGHVVKRLSHLGAEVTALDCRAEPTRKSLTNMERDPEAAKVHALSADVNDLPALQKIANAGKFDLVFHFAAYATVEKAADAPYDTIGTNTLGLVNVLEALRRAPRPPEMIFFASTDKVYGEMIGEYYQEDTTPLRGAGIYDAAKLAADVFARTYHEIFDLPTVVLRMCNLFGPYDFNTDYRIVPKAMKAIFGGAQPEPPELYADAQGHHRDYLYIDDAVRAILLLGYHPQCRGEVYNLMGGRHLSTPDMLRAIVDAASDIEAEFDAERAARIRSNGIAVRTKATASRVLTITKQHANGAKLRTATGFTPAADFGAALRRTARAYRTYFLETNEHARRSERVVEITPVSGNGRSGIRGGALV